MKKKFNQMCWDASLVAVLGVAAVSIGGYLLYKKAEKFVENRKSE